MTPQVDVVDLVSNNAAAIRLELLERLAPALACLDNIGDLQISSLYSCSDKLVRRKASPLLGDSRGDGIGRTSTELVDASSTHLDHGEGTTWRSGHIDLLQQAIIRWFVVPSDSTGSVLFPPLPLAPNDSGSLRFAVPPPATSSCFGLPCETNSFQLLCILAPKNVGHAVGDSSLCGAGKQEGTIAFAVTSTSGRVLVLQATSTDTVDSLLTRCFPPHILNPCGCVGSVQLIKTNPGNTIAKTTRVQDLASRNTATSSYSIVAVDLAGHAMIKFSVVPSWYRGGVACDGCRAHVVPTEGFLHCSTCRVDVCMTCLRLANLA